MDLKTMADKDNAVPGRVAMPELGWPHGYFIALVLMLIVGVLPYLFFKWKKWL